MRTYLHTFLIYISFVFFCSSNYNKQNNQAPNVLNNKFISDANYTKVIKNNLINNKINNVIGILFTNKNCQTCKAMESEIRQILQKFQKQNISIFRCQLADNIKLAQLFNVKRFPLMHFVYKKLDINSPFSFQIEIYKTSQIFTEKELQTGIYLKKIIQYQSKRDYFSNIFQSLQEIPSNNKIIVNFDSVFDKYGVKKQTFISNILLHQSFNSMPIVLLTSLQFQIYIIKHNLIHLKNIKNFKNSFILISIQTQVQDTYDHLFIPNQDIQRFQSNNVQLLFVFQAFLFYTVQQFTQSFYNIHQQLIAIENLNQQSIYLAIVDSIWERKQSQQQIKMLNRMLINNFGKQIAIFWTEGQINSQKKELLGFNKNSAVPLFGKLVLRKDQKKEPLKEKKSDKPIFTEIEIKRKIMTDLGYERLLSQKISNLIEELDMKNSLKVVSKIRSQINSKQIVLCYCTEQLIKVKQLVGLEDLISRFQRFYPFSKLQILISPCIFNEKQINSGLYLLYGTKQYFVSNFVHNCIEVEQKIIQITKQIAVKMNRKKILPKHFCVFENQMREYLMQIS